MFLQFNQKPNVDEYCGIIKKIVSLKSVDCEKNKLKLLPVDETGTNYEKK
jgi:hypothetical protein